MVVGPTQKLLFNGQEIDLEDCEKTAGFTINMDGTFTETDKTTDGAGNCETLSSDPGDGRT